MPLQSKQLIEVYFVKKLFLHSLYLPPPFLRVLSDRFVSVLYTCLTKGKKSFLTIMTAFLLP